MARMVEIATKKGGSLSPGQKWRGNKAKLKFLDAEGRPFEALPGNIRRGGWSPWEAGLSRDPAWHMALLRDIASRRGGKVEEGQTYANNTTKLWFIDAAGQRFGASPANVKGGQWSPYEGYTSEHICRQAVEHLFGGQSFPQSWDIVSRPNGNRLQLDGYNEAERCAFEYQGIYHEIIDEQKIRDREKVAFCAIAGIALAVVPEFKKKDKLDSQAIMDHVRKHVEDALRSSGRSEHVALLRTEGFEVNHATIGRNIIGMRELLKWMGEHWPGAAIAPGEFFKGLSEKLKVAGPDGMERFLSPGAIRSRQWEKDDLRREKTRDMVLGHAASLAKSTARKIKKANEAASMMKEEVFDTLSADDRSRIERMVSSSSEPVNAKQPPPLGDQAVFSLI